MQRRSGERRWNDRALAPGLIPARIRLRDHVLDMAAGELLTDGNQLPGLRRQALQVLLVLGSHASQVVSKDELMRLVWPNVVVSEGSLVQAIGDIRRVLGDAQHRVVRTVARRGYMLVPDEVVDPAVPLGPAKADDASVASPVASRVAAVHTADQAAGTGAKSRRPSWWRAIAAVGLVTGAGIWWAIDAPVPVSPTLPPAVVKASLPRNLPALSIVVLPLSVERDTVEIEWFADALLVDLTREVARLPGSFVIATDTAHTYKGKTPDPRDVARELGVRHVVRGNLRRENTVIRLSLALVDGETGMQRWAEGFVVDRAQLGQALDEFVLKLARFLSLEVSRSAAGRLATLSPAEVSADDLAMRGMALWIRGFNSDNLNEALRLFEQAVARDPDSIRGWGGLAFMNLHAGINGWLPDRAAAFRRINDAAAQLNRLDPEGFYTYQAKVIQVYLRKDWQAMLRLTEEWVRHHRHPVALGAYGMAQVLNGRPDEGVAPLELALRLSPRDPFRAEWQYRLSFANFIVGNYERARDWGQTAEASNPGLPWPPVHAAGCAWNWQRRAGKSSMNSCNAIRRSNPATSPSA